MSVSCLFVDQEVLNEFNCSCGAANVVSDKHK